MYGSPSLSLLPDLSTYPVLSPFIFYTIEPRRAQVIRTTGVGAGVGAGATAAGRPKPKPIKGVMINRKGKPSPKKDDPSEIHSGNIRFQSIQFAQSIHQVLEGSIFQRTFNSEESTAASAAVALVEVVGVLASPMSYHNFCWQLTVRDPTVQDLARRQMVTSGPNLGLIHPLPSAPLSTGPNVLHCQMYDTCNTVDQDTLERDQVVRIIGIAPQSKDLGPDKDIGHYKLQCVAIRR